MCGYLFNEGGVMADPVSGENQFPDFLNAIKDSSWRKRAAIYVNILIIVLTVSLLRNFAYPSREEARRDFALRIAWCLSNAETGNGDNWKDKERQDCVNDLNFTLTGDKTIISRRRNTRSSENQLCRQKNSLRRAIALPGKTLEKKLGGGASDFLDRRSIKVIGPG